MLPTEIATRDCRQGLLPSRNHHKAENHRPRTMRFQVLLVGFGEDGSFWPNRPRTHLIQGSVSGFGVDGDFRVAVCKGVLWCLAVGVANRNRQTKIHLPCEAAVQSLLRAVAMAGSVKIPEPASLTPRRKPQKVGAYGR